MNDKDIIKTQEAIIRLQEQVIYELLYDFGKAKKRISKYDMRINKEVSLCGN